MDFKLTRRAALGAALSATMLAGSLGPALAADKMTFTMATDRP